MMANCYVALFNGDKEVDAPEYSRGVVEYWIFNINYGVSNGNKIVFPAFQSNKGWGGKITHFALCRHKIGGRQYVKRSIIKITNEPEKKKCCVFERGCLQ